MDIKVAAHANIGPDIDIFFLNMGVGMNTIVPYPYPTHYHPYL